MPANCWHVAITMEKIMIPETWIYATWLVKVILYLGIAFIIGGAFCYFLLGRYVEIKGTILKYITIGTGLGLFSSVLGFFILIGSFANTGLSGMWDSNYINILVNTPTGHVYIIRSISFALLLIFMIVKLSKGTIDISKTEGAIFTILLTNRFKFFTTRTRHEFTLFRSSFVNNTCTCNVLMDGVALSIMENKQKN